MFKSLICGLMLILICGAATAEMFQSVAPESARLLQSGPGKLYCPNCGMNLVKFYKTSHAVTRKGGVVDQYCSMHCLVEVNAELDLEVRAVDAGTLELIPATEAHYVVGSDRPGTMTMQSKYAFALESDAVEFASANGGRVMNFAAAAAIARGALEAEAKMIGKKRERVAQKGEKIFTKMYRGGDLPLFTTLAEAKTYLVNNSVCGDLDDGQYQAVAIYLVGQNRGEGGGKIDVPPDAKCPVCGMFVAKYPQWAAEITTTDGRKYYFDGVKDLMKFRFDPARYHVQLAPDDVAAITVSDYYTLGAIDGRRAWYVIGSNIFGPMGKELIPFGGEEEAGIFLRDHFGERVIPFDGISSALVHDLDR